MAQNIIGTQRSAARKKEKLNPMARRALAAGTVGTVIEWYDYALYGAASALILPALFFPNVDSSVATLAAFATFGVGYAARPIGGLIIANLGDRYGRKPVLMMTIILMGAATMLMGLLPTYETVGVWAPMMLIVLRLLQGAGAGAELAGAMTMAAEYAPASRRSFVTAVPIGAGAGGSLLATLAFLLIYTLPQEQVLGWAWRIPFLASALLFAVGFYIRNRIEETPEFARAAQEALETNARRRLPLAELLRTQPKEMLLGALTGTSVNISFYVLLTFTVSYMTKQVGMSRTDALIAMSVTALVGFISAFVMGNIADRISPRKCYRLGGVFLMISAFPLFFVLQTGSLLLICIAMSLTVFFAYGASIGGQGAFLTNLFPVRNRFSGIAFTRELNSVAVAGTTPLIAAALVQLLDGQPWLVSAYMVVGGLVTVISVSLIRKVNHNDDHRLPAAEESTTDIRPDALNAHR